MLDLYTNAPNDAKIKKKLLDVFAFTLHLYSFYLKERKNNGKIKTTTNLQYMCVKHRHTQFSYESSINVSIA